MSPWKPGEPTLKLLRESVPRFVTRPYNGESVNRFARFVVVDRRSGEIVGYFRHLHDAQRELDRRNNPKGVMPT